MDANVYRQYAASFDDHWWTNHRRKIFGRWLARVGVEPNGDKPVLEIGSGAGTEHAFLSSYGPVTGVELNPVGIEFCAPRGYARLIEGNLNTVEFPVQSFDLAVDFHVLYHSWVEEPAQVLGKMRSALRPGGLLLLTEPAHKYLWRGHDVAVMARRRWSRAELIALVRSAGFDVVQHSAFLSLPLPLVWLSLVVDRLRHQREVSELAPPSRLADRVLRVVMWLERALMRLFPLPTGTCWAVLARRRED